MVQDQSSTGAKDNMMNLYNSQDKHGSLPAKPVVDRPGYYLPLHISSRFGARLRVLRQERQLTQLRMAEDFGIDRSFISDVERGRKSISLSTLEVLALGLNISLSELLKDL